MKPCKACRIVGCHHQVGGRARAAKAARTGGGSFARLDAQLQDTPRAPRLPAWYRRGVGRIPASLLVLLGVLKGWLLGAFLAYAVAYPASGGAWAAHAWWEHVVTQPTLRVVALFVAPGDGIDMVGAVCLLVGVALAAWVGRWTRQRFVPAVQEAGA